MRSMGLTWNDENALSGGASTPKKGLTALGAEMITRMEDMGIAVDLAHISEQGFSDALETVKNPPIVSHTAAYALHSHRRNLTDEQIRAIAERGGVIGVCLYPEFLGGTKIDTFLRHIEHIRNMGGSESVGIGTDFDGIDTLPEGITAVEDMQKVLDMLDEKVIGLNFARVLRDVL
jgi:membrane dipeptidase